MAKIKAVENNDLGVFKVERGCSDRDGGVCQSARRLPGGVRFLVIEVPLYINYLSHRGGPLLGSCSCKQSLCQVCCLQETVLEKHGDKHRPPEMLETRFVAETIQGILPVEGGLQGYLAHKKQPPPPRTTMGPWVKTYCRVLGGGCFI